MSGVRGKLYELWADMSNTLTNPLSSTKFLEEGVLTPEEFVAAGDLLVLKCPSWSWQDSNSQQKGLPKGKQYLITKNVPCQMRVSGLEAKSSSVVNEQVELDDGEGGWLATHTNEIQQADEDIPEIPTNTKEEEENEDDDIPEIDLSDLSVKEEVEDKATLSSNNVLKARSYDLSICYDQFHQTPRVWLFGYDENRKPLKPEQVLQDISQDHVNKTVTIATHPHLQIPEAYIHPCKHAAVMKKLIQRMMDSKKVPRVDQYLFIFLKFIHAAIPTIEYDYTVEMDLQ